MKTLSLLALAILSLASPSAFAETYLLTPVDRGTVGLNPMEFRIYREANVLEYASVKDLDGENYLVALKAMKPGRASSLRLCTQLEISSELDQPIDVRLSKDTELGFTMFYKYVSENPADPTLVKYYQRSSASESFYYLGSFRVTLKSE